ncbi:MAG: sulfatase-like hydrolase/transferase [Fuerstiella sp.]
MQASANDGAVSKGGRSAEIKSDRPNIVWLVSEDNSIHYMDLYAEGTAKTPAIAKLAKDGVTFNHAFSNGAVCSVARTTLATGCYGPRIGTQYHRKSVTVPMPDGLKMFSELLTDAGYYTANNRKTDYNAEAGENVWSDSSGKATWRNRKAGQPFFYMQSFSTSHEGKLHFPKRAMVNQKTRTATDSVILPPYFPDTETFRYTHAKYQDLITDVDAEIGKVVNRLEADGLLEDTIVFYFGDHGGVLPRGKGYAYESGLHVPFVVRIPEKWRHLIPFERGSRTDGFVSFVDFGPTVLNLASVKIPSQMDGVPFAGSGISKEDVEERDEAFGHADRFDEKYDLVRTLRKGRFEYIRNFQPFNPDGLHNFYRYKMLAFEEWRQLNSQGKLNAVQSAFFEARPAEQLFDIESDPHEVRNLASDPQYQSVLLDLRQRMLQRIAEMPDLSFYPESLLAADAFGNPSKFGRQHRAQISRYAAIANLQLLKFDDAKSEIEAALLSEDPMARYWACITCSAFGDDAVDLSAVIRQRAESDENNLVRARAAEFLGLTGQAGAEAILIDCVNDSSSGIEAGLVLNSVALLRDHTEAKSFEWSKIQLSKSMLKNDTVARRLEYFRSEE